MSTKRALTWEQRGGPGKWVNGDPRVRIVAVTEHGRVTWRAGRPAVPAKYRAQWLASRKAQRPQGRPSAAQRSRSSDQRRVMLGLVAERARLARVAAYLEGRGGH